MANPYGWSEELEEKLWHGTAEPSQYIEAMQGYRNVVDDPVITSYLTIEDLDYNLQTAGSGIGAEYYDWVLQVLPLGDLPAGSVDARLVDRVRAAAQGAAPDAELWNELTSITARLKNNLYSGSVFGHFNQGVVQPWKAQTPEPTAAPAGAADPAAGGDGPQNTSGNEFYATTPTATGGGDDGYGMTPTGTGGEEPPPYPTYQPPATLDECWSDATYGDHFRSWTMDKPIADNTMLCLAIEREYVSSPSWHAARAILGTYLEHDAQYHAYVTPESVEAIRERLPAEGEESGDPPGDLFAEVHGESSASLEQWYPTYVAEMEATPVQ